MKTADERLDELRRRKAQSEAGGGSQRIDAQPHVPAVRHQLRRDEQHEVQRHRWAQRVVPSGDPSCPPSFF